VNGRDVMNEALRRGARRGTVNEDAPPEAPPKQVRSTADGGEHGATSGPPDASMNDLIRGTLSANRQIRRDEAAALRRG
jgi:hypothetical protein